MGHAPQLGERDGRAHAVDRGAHPPPETEGHLDASARVERGSSRGGVVVVEGRRAFEGDGEVVFFEGDYSDYEINKARRLGNTEIKKTRYRKLMED